MRADGPAFPVAGVMASGNYFRVLGVRPALGRFFTEDDEPSVVLGHGVWQGRFGSSPDVVGRTIHVNGEPFTVVGVAPRGFGGTVGFLFPDVWVPHGAHDEAGWPGARVNLFARLGPDVDVATATRVAGAAAVRLPPEDDPGAEVRGVSLEPMDPVPPSVAGPARGFLGMLLGAAALVLLIAAANVAGMLLARMTARRRALAVRQALGVGRARLVRQLTLEGVGLFLLGGGLGVLGAAGAIRVLSTVQLPVAAAARIDATLDLRVVVVALGAAALTGLVFGLVPALQAGRPDVADTLRDGGRGASRGGSRLRDLFVAAQIALSVLLLVGATLFVRTVREALAADPGFDPEGVLVATVNLSPHGYEPEEGRAFQERLLQRVRALPGVESAALAEVALLTGESESSGWRTGPDASAAAAGQNVVDGAWFETMRIPVVRGRGIAESDGPDAPDVVVVNETFARRLPPGESVLGRVLYRGERPYRVVGVVRDGAYVQFGESPGPFVFLASAQNYGARRVLHVRARPGAPVGELVSALRAEVAALDPDVALEQTMPLSAAIGSLLFPQRFAALLIGLFGVLGLALACIGVYGVLAHHVARRTRELGIRVALGADARTVLAMVVRRGALLSVGGLAVGLAGAALLTRFLRSLLYGVSPLDATAFIAAPLALCLVALLAGVIPARRALAVDPVEAL
ncbi:MAG TPA: ADOP family duplicated permease, partial [Longimicrobiales bacterium]|nr:ADOP family duplicated permease [Longimicrobiales bacterium]